MLAAITQGKGFTSANYLILRVVAAFPLDVNLESASPAVHRALGEDRHALARLYRGALTTELITCQGRSCTG